MSCYVVMLLFLFFALTFVGIAFNNAVFVFGFRFTEIDEFSIYPH